MPSRFQAYCKQCSHNTFYHKTVISCMHSTGPVGGGGLGQWDGDSLSSWNMCVSQLERIGHSQLE